MKQRQFVILDLLTLHNQNECLPGLGHYVIVTDIFGMVTSSVTQEYQIKYHTNISMFMTQIIPLAQSRQEDTFPSGPS